MTVIVVLLTAVAITVSYGQTTPKLKVGVVAGKTVGLPQSPMSPNYTNNDRQQAQTLANFLNSRKPVAPTAPQIDALTLKPFLFMEQWSFCRRLREAWSPLPEP